LSTGAQNPAPQPPTRQPPGVTDDPVTAATTASSTLEAVVDAPGLDPEHAKRRGAGRNLPAASGVGVGLAALLFVPLFAVPQAFAVLAAVAAVLAALRATRALR